MSYAQTSDDWQRTVLQFTVALRTIGGIDAELDLFHTADHQQWSTFGPKQIEDSQFILIAVDATYRLRWEGKEKPGIGAGVSREAAAIKAIFDRDQQEALRRIKVVVLPGATEDDIPADLFGFNERFVLGTFDRAELDPLLRSLWGKPIYEKPPLGPIPALPALSIAEVEQSMRTASAGSHERSSAERDEHKDASAVDADDAATLALRLDQVTEELRELGVTDAGGGRHAELERERAALEASIDALTRAKDHPPEPPTSAGKPDRSPMVQRLIDALQHPSSDIRFEALSALDDHLDAELLPHIEPLLDDPDEFVQRLAYGYYGRLAGPSGVPRLVAALKDPNSDIRFEALSALDDHLDAELLPHIEPLLDDPDEFVQRLAYGYYGRLAGPSGVPRLVAALKDPNSDIRFEALSALDDHLDAELLPHIEPLLDDPDEFVQRLAYGYYGRLAK